MSLTWIFILSISFAFLLKDKCLKITFQTILNKRILFQPVVFFFVFFFPTLIIRQVIIPIDFPQNIISSGARIHVCICGCVYFYSNLKRKVILKKFLPMNTLWQVKYDSHKIAKAVCSYFFFLWYVTGT